MQRLIKAALLSIAIMGSMNAFAVDPTFTALFSDKAIRGYDTVAYFTEGKPVKGKDEFSTEYNGATWLFSSQAHLDLFIENPEKYAPQYGGYCAYAVANNTTASIQPELFTVHDGKLYLNYSKSINEKWLASKNQYIQDADKNWPQILAD